MKAIEYTTHISDNGVLSLPPEVFKKLNLKKDTKVKVLLLYEEENEVKNIGRFCGKWQDEKNASDIIKEVYTDRARNIRSEDSRL